MEQGNKELKKLKNRYDALALFSGGLDSILAVKLIQKQGLRVLGVHFFSPFFGKPEKIQEWEEIYDLEILPLDIGKDFIQIIRSPKWGYGKGLNPCIDCKIFMLNQVKKLLPMFSAGFIITGEVVGQRPMSQRKETMRLILEKSDTAHLVVRPLTAKNLPPSRVETEKKVDRNRLLGIRGRGRKQQISLAREFGIKEIPTPAGGCLLTDPECVQRFIPLLKNLSSPQVDDFHLAKLGRQFWYKDKWLVIGRNHQDNQRLIEVCQKGDLLFKLKEIPGPLAIGRQNTGRWERELIHEAAHLIVRYSRARHSLAPVIVTVGDERGLEEISIKPYCLKSPIRWKGPK